MTAFPSSQARPGQKSPEPFKTLQQPSQTGRRLKRVHVPMLQQNPSLRLSIRLARQTFGGQPEASNMCSIQKRSNTWTRAKTESGRVTETRDSTEGSAKSMPSHSRAAVKGAFVQHWCLSGSGHRQETVRLLFSAAHSLSWHQKTDFFFFCKKDFDSAEVHLNAIGSETNGISSKRQVVNLYRGACESTKITLLKSLIIHSFMMYFNCVRPWGRIFMKH